MSAYNKWQKGDREGAYSDLAKEAGVNAGYVSAYDKWQKGDRERSFCGSCQRSGR